MTRVLLACAIVSMALVVGCIQTKHEIEVKPIHMTIDVNVKVQQELQEKFKKTDEELKSISDKEAEDALAKYLESQKAN
ncbi:MAG TPA: hypothetical protein DET40_07295 [Lentisphaeria bacterium]|nr:MAG: hypothetical protein A2X45_07005 [Lentisphaerae bacterium GWF2_50_93]HCE43336.1 hypothetical protein [Lentisphaeria bacterium]